MRNISFALTTEQVRNRTKTVTRRIGWEFLKPGDLLQPVEKCQGLKKGGKIAKIGGPIRVVAVERQPLDTLLTCYEMYANADLRREGFDPSMMSRREFVEMFCRTHRIPTNDGSHAIGGGRSRSRPCEPSDEVTRIEFEYVGEVAQQGAA